MKGSSSRFGGLAGVLLVAAAATIWGTLGLVAKLVYDEGVSVQALVATRAVGAFLVIFAFLLFSGRLAVLKVEGRDLLSLVPLGVVSIGGFYLLYFYTIQESEVGVAAVLLYSSPAFVVLLARVFLGELLTPPKLLALFMTLTGILLVVGVTSPGDLAVRPLIVLTGLGAGLSYGLYSIVGKPLTRRLPTAAITCHMLGVGAVILLVFALPSLHTLFGLPVGIYAVLAASALVHTALAYALYTAGLVRLEAGQAAIVAAVEPVVAGAVGFVFLSEELTAVKVLGALLVVGGAAIAQLRLRRPPKSPAPDPAKGARLR
ncbi:EamA-like transporter family [Rubrobacter radiotolerans]|uniref:EamA family transporter n=1 Tax=Rubrobacter radiotolerans TaxID=42256 RepID=A0A023WZ06_RUBRA|nr:EamA family transporter [Rubrobacter radiotolerans]AHY45318.1 EamA-like transporter family [Rubrobacter radiotolerans]MDX5892730.1 EamA family transporter [Rubrobacter radiotolerans]SMC02370.1 drug/metabolite transporter, DME family [Rubrobacter radiotolerans DSM 5868]